MTDPTRRLLDSEPVNKEEQRLASLFRAAGTPAPLPEASVERIARRVRSLPTARRWFTPRALWGLTLLTPLAFAGLWSLRAEPVPASAQEVLSPSSSAPTSSAEVGTAPTPLERDVAPPAPVEMPPAASSPLRRPRAPSAPAPLAESSAPVAAGPLQDPKRVDPPNPENASPDPLVEEAELLHRALHSLRTQRDGAAALAVLDAYDARFPEGQLRAEAAVARVDALLVLQRPQEALAQLQQMRESGRGALPRRRDLRVLEAELLAADGRCEDALVQLKRLPLGEPSLEERAWFLQASCAARAGRTDEARSLFEEQLRRWPQGAHAAEARRAIGVSP